MPGATEFQYRVPWRAVSSHPGSHYGIQRGGGYEVHGIAPLYATGDPRRFDLRASLRDPFQQLLVRIYKQRSIVPVYALADVSASMSFVGNTSKFNLLIEFVNSLAYSAFRAGDPFAFTACDTLIREELSLPLTHAAGAGVSVYERLLRWAPNGSDATGLLGGAEQIPGPRALVFLISDFYLPVDLLRALLSRLCKHVVIAVVLVDSAECRVPGVGVTHLYDPESGGRRTLLLRRSLTEQIRKLRKHYDEQLKSCLAAHEIRPLYITDSFDPEAVTRYFYG